jgi:hypothetical protein
LKTILLTIFLGVFSLYSTQLIHASDKYNGLSGLYVELGGRTEPGNAAMGGGIGLFGYLSDHISFKGCLSFLGSEGFNDIFGGADIGLRCGLGTRFSPFIGFGAFAGYSEVTVSAQNDGIDNDNNGFIDEGGETKDVIKDTIASIYPETGLYYWIDDQTRLCLSGKYHVTTKGRDHDFWLFNIGLSILFDK